jgi:hypothetical protein
MHSTKTDGIKHHMQLLRQQFSQFESDPIAQALGTMEMEKILTEGIGLYRERVCLSIKFSLQIMPARTRSASGYPNVWQTGKRHAVSTAAPTAKRVSDFH